MQLDSTVLPLPILTVTDETNEEAPQYPYLQASLPLKVEEVFQETNGRNLGDVLKDAVQKVSIGNGELQSKIDQGVVKCKLAPSFGSLNKVENPSFKKMDDATIIMLWVSLKRLSYARRFECELTFETVEKIFRTNPFLELDSSKNVDLECDLAPGKVEFWKFRDNGEKKEALRRDIGKLVIDWFKKLVSDQDIRDTINTDIPLEEIQNILARTSSDYKTKLDCREGWEKTFLDVGVLRFPDFERPYIRVYHIRLHAWARCQNGVILERCCNGATGEYHLREYKPREKVIRGLGEETLKLAVGEGEKLIHNLVQGGATSRLLN